MIITESSTILTAVQLEKSKLLSLKEHLNALLRKKLRLETEISILRKTIKGKVSTSEKKIKASIKLESSGELTDAEAKQLREEHPELFSELVGFDNLIRDIAEIERYYDED
jgi:hypothetical protein